MAHGEQYKGAAFGLAAALLFGLSAPLAKLLLDGVGPLMLAGLLYLGGGTGLLILKALYGRAAREAALRRTDVPLLTAILVAGGIVGPVCMLLGLERVSGLAGALLLNLEGPLTILLAVVFFGEYLGRAVAFATLLVFSGALLLAWQPGALRAEWAGVAFLFAACLAWALDNNLTQRLSLRDPVAIALAKTLGAGAVNVSLALLIGDAVPAAGFAGAALLLGFFSYGISIVLDTYALRWIGAVREAAWFATAPFLGALAAVPLLGERISLVEESAFVIMALGVVILLRERHAHLHVHEEMEHEHLHVHDEHHRHVHEGPVTEPHSHPHRHVRLVHAHPHVPDLHHRHAHPKRKA